MSKKELLGLLFHGRLDQIVVRLFAFLKLNRALQNGKIFEAEKAHTKWRRAEQRILFGRTLSKKQSKHIVKLTSELRLHETDIVKLMYARALTDGGKLRFNQPIQIALAGLALINASLAFLWIVLTSFDLISNSGANPHVVFSVIVAIFVVPGLPAFYLAYCGVAPLAAFRRLSKKLAKGKPND